MKAWAHPARQPPQPGIQIYASRQLRVINKWQEEEDGARDLALAVHTDEQRHKLTDAAMVLQLQHGAMQLVGVGAISCSQWPGEQQHFRYRVVIHQGDAASAKIAELYKEWATQYSAKK